MKVYHGKFVSDRQHKPVVYVTTESASYDLDPLRSQQLANHSPDGFTWGYGGSGPAQLALAILLDYLNDEDRALELYQSFKWNYVARWPQEGDWSITGDEIEWFVVNRI